MARARFSLPFVVATPQPETRTYERREDEEAEAAERAADDAR